MFKIRGLRERESKTMMEEKFTSSSVSAQPSSFNKVQCAEFEQPPLQMEYISGGENYPPVTITL